MRTLLRDFQSFAFGGNVVDLAVGIAIGAAFASVVQTLVDHVNLPLVAAVLGEPNFDGLSLAVGDGRVEYGRFLTVLVGFLLLAFAIMLIVRAIHRATGVEAAGAQGTRECPHCLSAIPVDAPVCAACTRDVRPVAG